MKPYADDYVPKSLDSGLLADIYKPAYLRLNYSELLQKAAEVTISVSSERAIVVKEKNKGQAIKVTVVL